MALNMKKFFIAVVAFVLLACAPVMAQNGISSPSVEIPNVATVATSAYGIYLHIQGGTVPGDGGGGYFIRNGLVCTPDGITVLKDKSGNCFYKQPDPLTPLVPQLFGAKCNGSTNDAAAFALANAAASNLGPLVITGPCYLASGVTMTRPLLFRSGGMVIPGSGTTFVAISDIEAGRFQICDVTQGGHCNFNAVGSNAFVEWFGVIGGDGDAFNSAHSAINALPIIEAIAGMPPILLFTNACYSFPYIELDDAIPRTLDGQGVGCLIMSGHPFKYASDLVDSVTMAASISGNTLTVTGSPVGTIKIGQTIKGGSTADYTTITAFGSGSGANGTYTVNNSQSVAGQTLTVIDPCHSVNFGITNGDSTNGYYQTINNFMKITSNSRFVGAVAVCPNVTTLHAGVQTAWTIQASHSTFGSYTLGSGGNLYGAFSGWHWGWGNQNLMEFDSFLGDTYSESFVAPLVAGGADAIQKITHVSGQWAASNGLGGLPSHGTCVYQANNNPGSPMNAISFTNSPTFLYCYQGFVLAATAQTFGSPLMEHINDGSGTGFYIVEKETGAYSNWTAVSSNQASGFLLSGLSIYSKVDFGPPAQYLAAGSNGMTGMGPGDPGGAVYAGTGSMWLRTDANNSSQTPCFKFSGSNTANWFCGVVRQETGTTVPTLTFGGAAVGLTYSLQQLNWTALHYGTGTLVKFSGHLTLSNKGSSAGSMSIVTGIPYVMAATPNYAPVQPLTIGGFNSGTITAPVSSAAVTGTSTVVLTKFAAGGGATVLLDSDFTNSADWYISGSYLSPSP
jgi:hypothetical protein